MARVNTVFKCSKVSNKIKEIRHLEKAVELIQTPRIINKCCSRFSAIFYSEWDAHMPLSNK